MAISGLCYSNVDLVIKVIIIRLSPKKSDFGNNKTLKFLQYKIFYFPLLFLKTQIFLSLNALICRKNTPNFPSFHEIRKNSNLPNNINANANSRSEITFFEFRCETLKISVTWTKQIRRSERHVMFLFDRNKNKTPQTSCREA